MKNVLANLSFPATNNVNQYPVKNLKIIFIFLLLILAKMFFADIDSSKVRNLPVAHPSHFFVAIKIF
jgi:hypothetical protein